MSKGVVGHLDQDITGDVGVAPVIETELCADVVDMWIMQFLSLVLVCVLMQYEYCCCEFLELGSGFRIGGDVKGVVGSL
ncbi:hypothetical protein V6N11_082292 [Hibiscus sabdariffa]|uniref:Uncharacterized protein n=1 Tax=Hibiscus sabdariffa TaxID=183260 RepID=A0ABR2AG89_9ROSI